MNHTRYDKIAQCWVGGERKSNHSKTALSIISMLFMAYLMTDIADWVCGL